MVCFHFLLDFPKAFLSMSLLLRNMFTLKNVLKHELE